MGNEKYFTVTVVLKQEQDNGKTKTLTEKYLIKGFTLTDVEAKIVKEFDGEMMDYYIKSVVDSNIIKIIE